jgi:hypothetical protein
MSSIFTRLRNLPWLVFAAVFAWKIALFVLSAQPVPSNDSFFYDGAVVHQLLHGGYYNPSIALALPISGTQVFSAYPPLYQVVLFAWMSIFGTSVLSAIALHLMLFGAYALVVYLILRRLQAPVWVIHLAGLYLLLLTFHDRPDSLAHLLGMLGVLAWICSRRIFNPGAQNRRLNLCLWAVPCFTVLALCTSLQIGAIYFLWVWVGMISTTLAGGEKFPTLPMAATIVIPIALVLCVRVAFPQFWSGFLEHALQTPSYTGWRFPSVVEILKVARTAPGICLVAVFLPCSWFKQHNDVQHLQYARYEYMLVPALLGALAIVAACCFILTANTVIIANYLQPIIVASYLAFCAVILPHGRWLRFQFICLLLAAALGSVRAIGMSTWGLACAADVSYSSATHRIEDELSKLPPGSKVALSSAYLYDASKNTNLTLIHSDWLAKARAFPLITDLSALETVKPRELILTQFDYYRRYQIALAQLKAVPGACDIQITDTARVRPPDAYPSLQRVVQHISWAPVIIELDWHGQP